MFTKLFSSITTSSIWNEDNNTRIVWITMLAMANGSGYVAASVGGLAHEARVEREACEAALKVLMSPDPDSRSKEFEGKRIEAVDGGFILLNHEKYRAIRSEEERREYLKNYMVEYRRKHSVNKIVNNVNKCKQPLTAVNPSKPPLTEAEAEAEAEAKKKKKEAVAKAPSALDDFLRAWKVSFERVNGVPYAFTGGKELSSVQKLLKSEIPSAKALAVAERVWKSSPDGKHAFWIPHSKKISSFIENINQIISIFGAESMSSKPKHSNEEIRAAEIAEVQKQYGVSK